MATRTDKLSDRSFAVYMVGGMVSGVLSAAIFTSLFMWLLPTNPPIWCAAVMGVGAGILAIGTGIPIGLMCESRWGGEEA